MLSSEGDEWKRQRKIIAPAFSEKSNALVWKESLRQTTGMLKFWSNLDGNSVEFMKVKDTAPHTHVMALHVISGAGFGVRQVWDDEDEKELGRNAIPGFNTKKLNDNHKMAFKDSMTMLLKGVVFMAIFPVWFLSEFCNHSAKPRNNDLAGILPFQITKKLMQSHSECANYYEELYDSKAKQLESGETVDKGTMDLMGNTNLRCSDVHANDSRATGQGF